MIGGRWRPDGKLLVAERRDLLSCDFIKAAIRRRP
jgi:hypothetical protein